ncbi:MAG TPA: cytochrome c oxidase subunit II [Acidobacteriota bacterium]|nr:cytochrome c oxidase subunit II [Acidobacteriota bacterium]
MNPTPRIPRFRSRPWLAALGVAAGLLLAGTAGAWILDPVTPVAHEVRSLFWKALALTGGFFILAELLLLIAVIRFRARPGVPAAAFHDNVKLEVIWTAIPAITLVILAGPTFTTLKYMETVPKSDLTVEIIGHQWFWEYRYPEYGVVFANEPLVVPQGKIVAADITSIDVVHSWFVADFGVKMDANPGRVNHTWFQVERTGTFRGQCAELCGVLHGDMHVVVNVVTPEEFQRWIEQKKRGA